jgi:hypothetical protein
MSKGILLLRLAQRFNHLSQIHKSALRLSNDLHMP